MSKKRGFSSPIQNVGYQTTSPALNCNIQTRFYKYINSFVGTIGSVHQVTDRGFVGMAAGRYTSKKKCGVAHQLCSLKQEKKFESFSWLFNELPAHESTVSVH